ncbi:MAG: iron-containing alcohol dehydrogenase [candidate division WOR-3 bacterium]|nr:MAG: iron-containing alcohol dehydrogenase [candidate division WOR-3 bacterium]
MVLIQDLSEGLILSVIVMGIAGYSRPASNAKHQMSHGLDTILKNRGLDGTQALMATIFSLCLYSIISQN